MGQAGQTLQECHGKRPPHPLPSAACMPSPPPGPRAPPPVPLATHPRTRAPTHRHTTKHGTCTPLAPWPPHLAARHHDGHHGHHVGVGLVAAPVAATIRPSGAVALIAVVLLLIATIIIPPSVAPAPVTVVVVIGRGAAPRGPAPPAAARPHAAAAATCVGGGTRGQQQQPGGVKKWGGRRAAVARSREDGELTGARTALHGPSAPRPASPPPPQQRGVTCRV